MAFKKRNYKEWVKFFDQLVFKNGCNPYLLINDFQKDLIKEQDYEGAKAASDIFNKWHDIYKLSEKETDTFLTKFYQNHPVYGGKANFPILKHPGVE
jgi:hypothetical protein